MWYASCGFNKCIYKSCGRGLKQYDTKGHDKVINQFSTIFGQNIYRADCKKQIFIIIGAAFKSNVDHSIQRQYNETKNTIQLCNYDNLSVIR